MAPIRPAGWAIPDAGNHCPGSTPGSLPYAGALSSTVLRWIEH